MEDSLIIGYDSCPQDVPTLIVARKFEQDFTMLNKIQGDEAFGIYQYLIGNAELKSARDIPKKPIADEKWFVDAMNCPSCGIYLGFLGDDNNDPFCAKCGQAIDWEK